MILPYGGTKDFCRSSGLDVISGKKFNIHINQRMLRSLDWKPTHRLGESSLSKEMGKRMEKVMSVAVGRFRRDEIARITREVLGPSDGRPFTKEDAQKLTKSIVEFAARTLLRR